MSKVEGSPIETHPPPKKKCSCNFFVTQCKLYGRHFGFLTTVFCRHDIRYQRRAVAMNPSLTSDDSYSEQTKQSSVSIL